MRLSPAQRRDAHAIARAIVGHVRRVHAGYGQPANFAWADALVVTNIMLGRYHAASRARQAMLYDLTLLFIRDITGYAGDYPPFESEGATGKSAPTCSTVPADPAGST